MPRNALLQQFVALGDKTRYAIVVSLASKEGLCVSQLAERLDMTPAAISQHLKILERAAIVRPARTGRKVCCELNPETPYTAMLTTLIKQEERIALKR